MRQAKLQSAEELAATLEPLAQAMAALADEMTEIDSKSRAQGETFKRQLSESVNTYKDAAAAADKAAGSLNQAGQRMEWTHYVLAVMTGSVAAMLVSVFWLWLAPPSVQNQLDAKAVAEHLNSAVIEALRPSKGR